MSNTLKTEREERWRGKAYSFFNHSQCEAFPCHKGLENDSFNCLFCYCPLYMLDDKCGGNFKYTEKGVKNCADCNFPHNKENYGIVAGRFKEIAEAMAASREDAKRE